MRCVLASTAPPVCHCASRGGRNKQTALFAPGWSGAEDTGGAGEGRSRCVLELRQPGRGGSVGLPSRQPRALLPCRLGLTGGLCVGPPSQLQRPAYAPVNIFFFWVKRKTQPVLGKMKGKERDGERHCKKVKREKRDRTGIHKGAGRKGQRFVLPGIPSSYDTGWLSLSAPRKL